MAQRRVVIMGAAGRDFHDFNMLYRGKEAESRVVAFTATQIPRIDSRLYPTELAGAAYPEGIPIYPEEKLEEIIRNEGVDEVIFAYSDVSHEHVMHQASRVLAAGADFRLHGPRFTSIPAAVPVISVCAVRTGAGKSQTSRYITDVLLEEGVRPVVIRHPMPYGDLLRQRVQRFQTMEDLAAAQTTVEEREDYEPHLRRGITVYAGVDYEAVVEKASADGDVIVWDGGNNDFSFVESDLEIVVVDPFRPEHGLTYHPGEVNLRRADVVVVNKVGSAPQEGVDAVMQAVREVNPNARCIKVSSSLRVEDGGRLKGARALVVEDGPTLTHGGMSEGAGMVAAREYGVGEVVDPRSAAVGSIAEVYKRYPHLGSILPAIGYYPDQLRELEETVKGAAVDVVISATPLDIRRLIHVEVPVVQVDYELEELESPGVAGVVRGFLADHGLEGHG